MKDVHKDMEDLIVKGLTQSCPKNGESTFTWDILHGNTSVGSISPTSIFVSEDTKEMAHILMTVDMTKKVEEEQARRIVTRRSKRRITIGNKRPDEREIDKRNNHPAVTALDIAIFENPDKAFSKPVG
jgi:hypothetical protein